MIYLTHVQTNPLLNQIYDDTETSFEKESNKQLVVGVAELLSRLAEQLALRRSLSWPSRRDITAQHTSH